MSVIYWSLGVLGCFSAALGKLIFLAEDENGDGWRKVSNLQLESAECFRTELASGCWRFIQLPYQSRSGSLQAFLMAFCFIQYSGNKISFYGDLYPHRHGVFMSKQEYQCSVEILLTADVIGHSEREKVEASCTLGDWLHIIIRSMGGQMMWK